MVTNLVTALLIVTGLTLIIIEQIFSYSLINHASTFGFLFCVIGVLLLSFRTVKRANRVEKKYYDHFSVAASSGGGETRSHSNRKESDSNDIDMSGGDYSGGGDGGG